MRRLALLGALLTLVLIPAYLQAFLINGPSEAPTILLGDRVVVNRLAYRCSVPYSDRELFRTGAPERGDLVLFQVPNKGVPGVKRVIGVPGDTVEMRENVVLVNGAPLPVQPVDRRQYSHVPPVHQLGSTWQREDGHTIVFEPGASPLRTVPPVRLDAGRYYLLGDHRDNSNDSRVFGAVSGSLIQGKVIAILPTGPRV